MPTANNEITFSITGPAEIVATDNGNPADLQAFPSKTRAALSGLVLAIVRSKTSTTGQVTITASSPGLKSQSIIIATK